MKLTPALKKTSKTVQNISWIYLALLAVGLILRQLEYTTPSAVTLWSSFFVAMGVYGYSIVNIWKYIPDVERLVEPTVITVGVDPVANKMINILKALHLASGLMSSPAFVTVFILGWPWGYSVLFLAIGLVLGVLFILQYKKLYEYFEDRARLTPPLPEKTREE